MSCAAAVASSMLRNAVERQLMSPQQVVWVNICHFWTDVSDLNNSYLDVFPPKLQPNWLLADSNPQCLVMQHLRLGCVKTW